MPSPLGYEQENANQALASPSQRELIQREAVRDIALRTGLRDPAEQAHLDRAVAEARARVYQEMQQRFMPPPSWIGASTLTQSQAFTMTRVPQPGEFARNLAGLARKPATPEPLELVQTHKRKITLEE